MQFRYVFNRKNKLNKDGKASISLYISLNRKIKWLNTGIYINPDEWDASKRLVNKKNTNHIHINAVLKRKVTDLEEWYYEQIQMGRQVSLHNITLDHGGSQLTFYQFVKNEVDRNKYAYNTVRNFNITIDKFQKFAPNVPLNSISRELIDDFEISLRNENLHTNTIHRYLKQMRKFLNAAEAKEHITEKQNPFHKKKLKTVKTEPRYLDPEVINELKKIEFSEKEQHLEDIRDLFLFSVYTGLRYSDIISLEKNEIHVTEKGYYIQRVMKKTVNSKDTRVYIPLWSIFKGAAQDIINKHISEERDTIFKPLTNQYLNRELRKIWQKIGVAEKYTFHSARHTCATYLLYKGINIKVVQKILGHEDLKTTENYAKVLRKTIDSELDRAEW
jgi:site-specific recombinase XerD